MSHGSHSAHAPWLRTPLFAYAAELRVLQAVRALAVAQPADCCVAAERVVNIAKLVSVPQRRSAARHSAATPCTVRGAFVAAEKVSCGLRVSMR